MELPDLKIIGHIHTDFPEKFGIPRQSGLAEELTGRIVFLLEYRDANAFRGLEGFTHLWLLWLFSEAIREKWRPMVHPPRLGGNTLMGVFATRAPYRPNPIGLSSVKLESVTFEETDGPVLTVRGADLMDGTPILDVKPYLPYTDSHPDAADGFAGPLRDYRLDVTFPEELLARIPEHLRAGLLEVLAQDPRPQYHDDPIRRYGFGFAGKDVRFRVENGRLIVVDVVER